jgi:hypothetical protein
VSGVESSVTAGERWHITVDVTGDSGEEAAAPTYEVTGAGTASGTMTLVDGWSCRYEAYVPTAAAGWYMAVVTYGADVLNLACYADPVVAPGDRVTVADVEEFLRESSWTTEEVADALAAEEADQRARCYTAPVYPPSLFHALKRRAARALAMQTILLGVQDSADGFVSKVPRWDAEIRRYEAPYRRMVIG